MWLQSDERTIDMEAFKLLTRSTNVKKAKAIPAVPAAKVPSAGILGDYSERESLVRAQKAADVPPRGKKRKRHERLEAEEERVPPELDLLALANSPAVTSNGSMLKGQGAATSQQPSGQGYPSAKESLPLMAEQDRRHVLKKNKLKVTILQRDDRKTSNKGDPKVKASLMQIAPQPVTSFAELHSRYRVSRRICENLSGQGYHEPTEVQIAGLPLLLGSDEERCLPRKLSSNKKHARSHVDLLTVAPTGSGKTLAFLIPTLQGLLEHRLESKSQSINKVDTDNEVQALIIAPTHELVDQIVNEGRKWATGTGVKIAAMRKGMRLHEHLLAKNESQDDVQNDDNAQGNSKHDFLVKTHILVSTPLLLVHALSSSPKAAFALLPSIKYLILDEADVLLDPLFREQTINIWNACSSPSLQTSLWSATIGSSIESLAKNIILDRQKRLNLSELTPPHYILRLVVGLKDSAVPNVSHRLIYAASEQGKLLALRQLIHPSTAPSRSSSSSAQATTPSLQPPFLIFTQTIARAIALHSELLYDIPPEAGGSSRIAVLHSDLSDTARSTVMAGFRRGEIWILITTDLLSRGMDFRGMNGVVNYDIPNTGASYVHRAGRTGRQGRQGGVSVTLYTKEDIPYVKNVANVIAASERAKGKKKNSVKGQIGGVGDDDGGGVQQWLLDSLPDVSKQTRKNLKRRGVESRRQQAADGVDLRKLKKMRISSKSGYDRRMENRRKGAVAGSRARREAVEVEDGGSDGGEWTGFE